jgi:hypothetical protein
MSTLVAVLLSSSALAAEFSDGAAGTLVALGSVGGAAAGALGGGAIGFAVGAQACSDAHFECWGPLIGVGIGGSAGAGIGAFAGTGLTAKAVGRKPGRAMLGSLIGLGTGIAVGSAGLATDSGGLALAGMALGGIGVPLGGGIAAGTERTPVTLTAEHRDGYQGLRLAGRF